jgi:hypothetical protein
MQEKDYLYFRFLGDKCIRFLFKEYLGQLEDMQREGVIDEDDFEYLRKRILDKGNDSARFFEEQAINYYELNSEE